MTLIDSTAVRRSLERSADPITGRAALARLVDAHPTLVDELANDTPLLDATVAVSVASRSLLAVLERDEHAIEMLRPDVLHAELTADALVAQAHDTIATDDPPAALRRWKHRHMVRVAARDLLGLADMRVVGADLAGVAQACLGAALAIAAPTVPMA